MVDESLLVGVMFEFWVLWALCLVPTKGFLSEPLQEISVPGILVKPCLSCLGKMSTGILINYYQQQLLHMCGLAIFPRLGQGLVHQVASCTRKVLSGYVPSTWYCWMGRLCLYITSWQVQVFPEASSTLVTAGHPADQWQSWEYSRNVPGFRTSCFYSKLECMQSAFQAVFLGIGNSHKS